MRDGFIHVKEYGDVYVDKETCTVYRLGQGRCQGQLLPVAFHKSMAGAYVFYRQGCGFIKRSHAIALALVPRPEGAKTIRHIDGDPANDAPSNLMWVPPRDYREVVREATKRWKQGKVFLSFEDGRQYWCAKEKVKHLLDLKPRARGPFIKEKYAPDKARK